MSEAPSGSEADTVTTEVCHSATVIEEDKLEIVGASLKLEKLNVNE